MLFQFNKTITRLVTLVISFSVLSIVASVAGFSMAAAIDLYVAVIAFVSVIISNAKKTAAISLDALCVPLETIVPSVCYKECNLVSLAFLRG